MQRCTFTGLCLAFMFIPATLGALYHDPSQLPRSVYDYVIVGAGNAGNVIASRLTENPRTTVLVLEAGVSNEGVIASIVPFLGPSLAPNTPYDWNFTTTAQAGFNNRSLPYPRGRLLGGCTSVNYMAHMYGSSEDYDRIAAVTGDPGWKWENVKKNIGRVRRF
ncbi:uncharacterized protein LACBIDRAFT_311240 [Laccaria bicolor S238N-H82]|uniref:Predicted protein n=1 Tax=Laccaria bicolor (strain S238N-H82 / ATCC MYA-4686) TaxID=486041 RepID=B0CZI9_LACBS|nr:uncharacterized protein LACBIDRAFT_311240 [Laccaria bicolor S238N-H82]EDR12634.1 predicted protein [Laccaria bicolor S238N-H82]|eukprot:XP_001876898.1 predicted protein [Laccaria bicolor S238N-H82]